MSYLVLNRRPGNYVRLDLQPDVDPETVLADLRAGGILISITEIIDPRHVRLEINAPRSIRVMRKAAAGGIENQPGNGSINSSP